MTRPRSMAELLTSFNGRLGALERRLNKGGGGGGGSGSGLQPGAIIPWAASTAPDGFLIADGSLLSRTDYAVLFAVIGTTYGAGDGSTTFAIPDLTGKVIFGLNPAVTAFNALGKVGGSANHSHGLSSLGRALMRMATGSSVFSAKTTTGSSWTADSQINTAAAAASTTASGLGVQLDGTTDPESTLPPYIVMRYIIKTADGGGVSGTSVDAIARASAASALAVANAAQADATTALSNQIRPRTSVVLNAASGAGSVSIREAFRLIHMQSSAACRVRLYRSSADRATDLARPFSTAPDDVGIVLADFLFAGAETFYARGMISSLVAGSTTVYWQVDDGPANVTITYVRED